MQGAQQHSGLPAALGRPRLQGRYHRASVSTHGTHRPHRSDHHTQQSGTMIKKVDIRVDAHEIHNAPLSDKLNLFFRECNSDISAKESYYCTRLQAPYPVFARIPYSRFSWFSLHELGQTESCERKTLEWSAYAHFHHGEHDKALLLYKELLDAPDADSIFHTYAAACLFYMAAYEEAIQAALKGQGASLIAITKEWMLSQPNERHCCEGPECALQRRILLHVAHRQNNEKGLLEYRNGLGDSPEDQISLASIHFMRTQYQEAIDIYKKLLLSNRHLSLPNSLFLH